MKKITTKTFLAEILEDHKAKKILEKYNLPCLECPFAKAEMENLKIGDVCKLYGIETDKLLKELQEELN